MSIVREVVAVTGRERLASSSWLKHADLCLGWSARACPPNVERFVLRSFSHFSFDSDRTIVPHFSCGVRPCNCFLKRGSHASAGVRCFDFPCFVACLVFVRCSPAVLPTVVISRDLLLSYMFGDNLSVVNSSVLPSGKLQKRAHILNYHRLREAQAAGIVRFVHIDGKENPADILTKPRSSRDWADRGARSRNI